MSTHESEDGMSWVPTWTQAMTHFRGEDDKPPFDDVTVRMTVPASIAGGRVPVELSNRFGDEPIRIERGAIGVGDRSFEMAFDGQRSIEIPAGESRTDPVELTVSHGDGVVIDFYLPEPTPYATANGFTFDRSTPGDFVGSPELPREGSTPVEVDESREFPAANAGIGLTVNDWIRTAGHEFVDFDAAIRSETDASRLEDNCAGPDRTHPNVHGEKRLAQAMVEALAPIPESRTS